MRDLAMPRGGCLRAWMPLNWLADLNIDGDVGILDLLTLLANWG